MHIAHFPVERVIIDESKWDPAVEYLNLPISSPSPNQSRAYFIKSTWANSLSYGSFQPSNSYGVVMVRRWWIVILFFCESYIYDAAKNLEIKYEYIRNVWIKSRNVLRNNQKLIIKKYKLLDKTENKN